MRIFIAMTLILFLVPLAGRADNMSTFLKNCAYGTLGGAAVGLATLAMSENPNSKISNVARGASLGLYAGIGYGIYKLNNPTLENSSELVWLSPSTRGNQLEGLNVHWLLTHF